MNTTDYIFIDYPIKNYLYGTQVKEISVRKSLSKLMRFLRKLPIFSKFISNTQEITDWDTQCKGAHAIILFDTFVHYSTYCKKIEEMAPKDARLILYLLNPAFFSDNYKLLSSRWEIWTFMEEDAHKFGFKYGATFYNPLLKECKKNTKVQKKPSTDLLFIGTDKGRKTFLLHLKKQLKAYHIRCDFRIVNNFKSLYSKDYAREVDYFTLCQLTNNTQAIVDVVQKNQTGLTLRIMEGILFDKKIVTTNLSMRTNKDFGNNSNIYVLTPNNIKGLNAFLNKPTETYPLWIKEKYSFDKWIERLDKSIEAE